MSTLRNELRADPRLPPDGKVDTLSTVVGSWSFLSLMPILSPHRLILFDINPSAVIFFAMIVGLLRTAASRSKFLSYFFGRHISGDDMLLLEAEVIEWMTGEKSDLLKRAGATGDSFRFWERPLAQRLCCRHLPSCEKSLPKALGECGGAVRTCTIPVREFSLTTFRYHLRLVHILNSFGLTCENRRVRLRLHRATDILLRAFAMLCLSLGIHTMHR